jgi:hypothetical protein
MEAELLQALATREGFRDYYDYVKKYSDVLATTAQEIVAAIPEYYAVNTAQQINWATFSSWYRLVKAARKSSEEQAMLATYFSSLAVHETDEVMQHLMLNTLKERALAEDIITLCEPVARGLDGHSLDSVVKKLEEYSRHSILDADKHIVTGDIDTLVGAVLAGGLNWKQLWMNQSCGPLRKGDFVCLVARPDTGKTSFLSGQANCFAAQSAAPVLWINNEQEGRKVRLRLLQEATSMTNADITVDRDKLLSKYNSIVGPTDKVLVIDKAGVSAKEIEKYCEDYQPCAIIIDQLWKVKGFGNDNSDVKVQTAIANWARELCKTYAPVIGVYQADAQAEGQSYFGMDKIYMSKTAVQGEADLIICMGRLYEQGKEKIRYFSFPKNKMSGGGKHYQPTMRNYRHESMFNPDTGEFK